MRWLRVSESQQPKARPVECWDSSQAFMWGDLSPTEEQPFQLNFP